MTTTLILNDTGGITNKPEKTEELQDGETVDEQIERNEQELRELLEDHGWEVEQIEIDATDWEGKDA